MLCWYESTPTVITSGGITTYVNWDEKRREAMKKDAALKMWLDRADASGTYPVVVTREAAVKIVATLDAKALTDAKLAPETTDVAPPTLGTKEVKDAAVAVKMATPILPAEYDKLVVATGAKVAADVGGKVAGEDVGVGKLP